MVVVCVADISHDYEIVDGNLMLNLEGRQRVSGGAAAALHTEIGSGSAAVKSAAAKAAS